VEVVERLLGDWGIGCTHEDCLGGTRTVAEGATAKILDFGDVASHELDRGLGKLRAGVVVDGDPADDIGELGAGGVGGFGDDYVVGGLPAHTVGDVVEFSGEALCFGRVDLPAERGLEEQTISGDGKDRQAGKLELQMAVDFDERIVAGADDVARNGGCGKGAVLAGRGFDDLHAVGLEVDGLAFVFLEQPGLVDDAGIVALLGDVDECVAGGVAQDDRVGLELTGDVGREDLVDAGVEIERDAGASDGEVLVIDGELRWGDGGLLREERKCDEGRQKKQATVHVGVPLSCKSLQRHCLDGGVLGLASKNFKNRQRRCSKASR
jgi:hypothetical protein